VVVGIRHDDPVCVGDRDVVRVLQLSRLVAHGSELGHECAVALEHLDSVVLLVAHVDEAECVRTDSPGIVELAVAGSLGSKCSNKLSTRIKYLDPVVVTVCNDVLTDPVDGYAGQAVELALAVTVASQPEPVLTVLVEYLHPVVGGVGNDDGVVRSNRNTSRPCKKSGLAPPSAEFKYQGLFLEVLIFRHTTYTCGALQGLLRCRSGGACRVF